jgi:hypothetical protein
VKPDWDWCQQCGYDPDHLRPNGVEIDLTASRPAAPDSDGRRRRLRAKKKAAAVEPAPVIVVDPRPLPPRQPTETVYGALPYDHPSSIAPLEPEEPDNSEILNRRFAMVALGVIVVGLAVLVASLFFG